MSRLHLSAWLHPEPVAAGRLDGLVRRLAGAYGTPVVPAHLTVVGGFDDEEHSALERFGRLAAALRPAEVTLTGVRCEDVLHRSVYLTAEPTRALRAGFELGVALWSPPDRRFDPHVSLQYSDLPLPVKRRLAGTVDLPLPYRVRFDRLSLWCTEMSDLRRWRELAVRPLGPP